MVLLPSSTYPVAPLGPQPPETGQTAPRTPAAPPLGAGETQLLARYQGPHLTAQLHVKPATVEPVLVPPPVHTQLIVQLAGTMQLSMTRQGVRRSYQSVPGSVYLNTPQQLPYELAWHGPSAVAIQTIQLDLDQDLLRQTASAAGFDAARLELPAAPCLEAPLLQQLGYSLAAMLQAPGSEAPLYAQTVAHMLAAQLVYQHRAQPLPASRGQLAPERLRQIREYVHSSLSQAIDLDSLAAIACLSPYHFCRLFKQSTGRSPHQYVVAQRMERARDLLRRLPIAQVARAVGYRHAGHFARLFHRHWGVLPTEWARQGLAQEALVANRKNAL